MSSNEFKLNFDLIFIKHIKKGETLSLTPFHYAEALRGLNQTPRQLVL